MKDVLFGVNSQGTNTFYTYEYKRKGVEQSKKRQLGFEEFKRTNMKLVGVAVNVKDGDFGVFN